MLPSMFRSATLRLTVWYLLILMAVSVIFSIIIFEVASVEIETRLEHFQNRFQTQQSAPYTPLSNGLEEFRTVQVDQANQALSLELLYVNLFMLAGGGFISYFLARRNLRPIEKAHEAQSRFTSDASHELRTPLAVMKTEIEVALRDKTANVSALKETLASNLEEVNKLSKLSEMLLSLSKFDHAKLQLGPVDLVRITKNVVGDFNKISDRIALTFDKNLVVRGNEVAISELIKVLLDNALLYSPKDSVVTIHLSRMEDKAKFEITNFGAGITADKLPHIFDRFYRADSSRTNGDKKGYGLGLALAKSIVELHSGELIATSTPDVETTFAFILSLNSKVQAKTKS